MPRTFDRWTPRNDKDPNRFGLDYTDPQGAIDESATRAAGRIRNSLVDVIKEKTGINLAGGAQFTTWLSEHLNFSFADIRERWDDLKRTADDAKLSADNANLSIEKLKAKLSGGGFDEFDYADAPALPTSTYNIATDGPGNGTYGPNGIGYLVWKPSGALAKEVIYRRTDTTLGGDNGIVTVVWASKPKTVLVPKTRGYICGRMSNTANDTHVRASISDSDAKIEAVVDGDVTVLKRDGELLPAKANLTVSSGDVFEFYYGSDTVARKFWLRQNGVTVLEVVDDDDISAIGASYRSVGFGCQVENYLLVSQNPAPSLVGWTWALQEGA